MSAQCPSTIPFKPAPDHSHRCKKPVGHRGRHRCACIRVPIKCDVSWKAVRP